MMKIGKTVCNSKYKRRGYGEAETKMKLENLIKHDQRGIYKINKKKMKKEGNVRKN